MSTDQTQTAATRSVLPSTTRVGAVHLTITDLDRSIAFYEQSIGLRVHRREAGVAALGAGAEDLLVLHEEPDAHRAGGHAGLYHFALLHPSREELAHAALRLAASRRPIQGASDHRFSEAIYLPDPDGNGIELYADRPKEMWPDASEPMRAPMPLDMQELMGLAAPDGPRPHADRGLVVGHLHLHVGDVDDALRFYVEVVGFEPTVVMPGAAFVSAGGYASYHHHLGLNTWRGDGVDAAPSRTVGLRRWTILVPGAEDLARVRERVAAAGLGHEDSGDGFLVGDPWGNPLAVELAPAGG